MIAVDRTTELFADQAGLLRRLVTDAIATHPVVGVDLRRRSLDMVDGVADAESFLHDGGVLTALCDHALAFHAAGEHAAALAWGKAAYVANRRSAHAWLDFLDIALGAQAIAETGLEMPNRVLSFRERLKRSQNIPPSIVQYWDTDPPPDDVAAVIAGWARLSPKYTHRLVHDADARAFLATHGGDRGLAAYEAAPNVASRADIFRLAWIAHHGGIYADADEWPLDDIDLLLPANTGLVLNWSAGSPPCVNNWFIAARPRHPLVMAQLRLAVSHILDAPGTDPQRPAWVLTGPGVVSMVLLDHVCFLPTGRVLADVVLQPESEFRRVVGFRDNAAHTQRLAAQSTSALQKIDTPRISYFKLPLQETVTIETAYATWLGFVQLHPEETPVGPDRIYELDDNSDGTWRHDFHWKRPPNKISALGCYFVRDVELWAPGVAVHDKQFVSDGSHPDRDNQLGLPVLRADGFFDVPRPRDRFIDHPVLLMDGMHYLAWGHWIVEYLPRVAIARKLLGNRFNELRIPLPDDVPGWAIELLTRKCDVQREAIFFYKPYQERLVCARVVQPTQCFTEGFVFHSFFNEFFSGLRSARAAGTRKLCVSRSGDPNAFVNDRTFPLRETFENMAARYGYELIRPEELTIDEQIKVFSEASIVVGEYGSGMHNAVFCGPKTIIGCIGFWNPLQLHIGYVCGYHSIYLTRGCVWPTEESPGYKLNVSEESMVSFFEKIENFVLQSNSVQYLILPLDNQSTMQDAFATWRGFVQLYPEEMPSGPNRIYEFDDGSDGTWRYDFHWKRPAEKVDAIGCNFVRDIELWAPSIALQAGQPIGYGVEADWDNWRALPTLKENGFFDVGVPVDRFIDRPILIADGGCHSVWGHWLVDYLPRFAIARDLLGARFDEFLVPLPFEAPDWAIDLLESTCSVRPSNILRYRPYAERLICARAVIPSYCYSETYTFHSFFRRLYHRLRTQRGEARAKICISRGGVATAGSNRRFPLRARFEDMARDRGYQIVLPETLSLSDQIKLFADASVVVGEHGSGMHNTVFCDPGTIVGCIGFWNAIQLHIGYVCEHRNVYLARGCIWPTEGQPEFQLAVSEEDLSSFLDKIDELSLESARPERVNLLARPAEEPREKNVVDNAMNIRVAPVIDEVIETDGNDYVGVAPPVGLEVLTHVQDQGDVTGTGESWAGNEAVTHWIEGFAISPTGAIEPADLIYRALLIDGSISPWVSGGEFCGTRGQGSPLLGFQIQLRGAAAAHYECLSGALFADQTRLDPSLTDTMRVAPSSVPIAAIWIELRPKDGRIAA